jgi:integrase
MATIEERVSSSGKVTYRAKIRVRGHAPISQTFERKADARKWARDLETDISRGANVSTEADRTTLKEALERYVREQPKRSDGKPLKGWDRQQDRAKAWMKSPLAHRFLSQLRGTDFAHHRDVRRAEGRAENTIRLELALISTLYKLAAREWRMEGLRNPIQGMTMPGGSNKRDRRVTAEEERELLAQLASINEYMAPLCSLAIETAMRQGELLSLTWADVNLQQRVAKLRDTKNSEPRDVPLSSRAVEILKALPRSLDSSAPVFPLTQDNVIRMFRAACEAANIKNLKFHDLRHEATSRICDKVPMHEAMRITGHKTPSMLMRYYHPKAEELARKLG